MTLLVSQDGASVGNDADLSGSPAVRFTGDGVRFVNRGSIVSTSSGVAAVVISGTGGTFTNASDGEIEGVVGAGNFALQGSSGKDILIDAGIIRGRVSLGAGDDTFVSRRDVFGAGTFDLGGGNDVYRQESGGGGLRDVSGGAGYDRLVLTGPSHIPNAASLTRGFEQLEVGTGSIWNLGGFSGYQKVILSGGTHANFLTSANPDADISFTAVRQGLTQMVIAGPGSVFRNVTGTSQVDRVEVAGSGRILGDVALLGGNDEFWFSHNPGQPGPPGVGGIIDGGAGFDMIHVQVGDGYTVDLAPMTGFEWLAAGTWSSPPTDVRLINGNGLQRIDMDVGRLVLGQFNSPAAVVRLLEGTLVLESTVTVGQLGVGLEGGDESTTPSADYAIRIVNRGTTLGDVFLSYGHDVFDGRLGSVGGAIHGYAGNDRLTGGLGDDEIIGGFGHDRLDGGPGADLLTGGGGHDVYVVDQKGDQVIEAGGSGNDTVESAIGYALPTHVEKLVLTGRSGIDGRGNSGANTLTGNSGGNFLNGGRGDDVIDGGAGNDWLMGNLGIDRLTGGAGADRFYFNVAPGGANADRILDFAAADDSLYLLRPVFASAGANGTLGVSAFHRGSAAADAGDRILYDQATGRIYYDADGTGAAAPLLFATVDAGTPLTNADFLIYG